MNDEDLERRVATTLQELYPEPAEDTLTIPHKPRRRPARVAAIVGAMAAVAAVGISVGLLKTDSPSSSGQSTSSPAATSAASGTTAETQDAHDPLTDPAALMGFSWKLATIKPVAGAMLTPSAAVELRLDRGGTMTMACNAATADIQRGRIVFHQPWINNLVSCADLSIKQYNFVYGHVLSRTITWSITNQHLTITKTGVASLVFTKVAANQ